MHVMEVSQGVERAQGFPPFFQGRLGESHVTEMFIRDVMCTRLD